jgi:hypothetical protein
MLGARFVDLTDDICRPFHEPGERLLRDGVVAGISGLHVSLVERIEPDDIAVLVAGLRIREGMASLFREIPQKGKVVRGWTVVREDQKEAGVDLLKRLMQQESRLPEVTLIM